MRISVAAHRFWKAFDGAGDFLLFFRVLILHVFLFIALRTMTPFTIVSLLSKRRTKSKVHSIEKADKYARFLSGFESGSKQSCLKRSLILFRLFNKAGLKVRINFGLERENIPDKGFAGHSWICLNGKPFNEKCDPNTKYMLMYTFPRDLERSKKPLTVE